MTVEHVGIEALRPGDIVDIGAIPATWEVGAIDLEARTVEMLPHKTDFLPFTHTMPTDRSKVTREAVGCLCRFTHEGWVNSGCPRHRGDDEL